MPDVRPSRTGTTTSRGDYKTTRQYTLDGLPHRKEFVQRKGESKTAVRYRADAWLSNKRGTTLAPVRRLETCIDLYLEYRRDDNITKHTLRDDIYVGRLLTEALGAQDIERLDAIGIELALRKWVAEGKMRTAKKVRDFGRKLYKWLKKRRWTQQNPFEEAAPVSYAPDRWEEPMPAADFDKAIALVEEPNIRALLILLRYTGIRPKSARELIWSELEDGDMMFVRKQNAKRPSGEKPIPVPSVAAQAIRALPKTSMFVFPSKRTERAWSETWVGKQWRQAQKTAGLTARHLYDLKHLRITELRAGLMDDVKVAAAAGMKSVESVQNSYAQIDRAELHRQVDSMNKV